MYNYSSCGNCNDCNRFRPCGTCCKPGARGPAGPKGDQGPKGEQGPPGGGNCECCIAGLRAVLGYLLTAGQNDTSATDIRVETIAQQPAVNNVSIFRFYPDATNFSTALLVEFSNGTIVSICQIEVIQSALLLDRSGVIVPELQQALDETISKMTEGCKNCCQEELRKLFQSKISTKVSNIDTNRNNAISGNNTVRGTGAALVVIDIPGVGSEGNKGAAVNLCFVSSVQF
jgi:hypothetical protein